MHYASLLIMTPEETSENPFSVTPEDRRHAEQLVSDRMLAVEKEHRLLGRIRSHVYGGTPIGKVLTALCRDLELRDIESGMQGLLLSDDEAAKDSLLDFLAVQGVLLDFFAETERFREARTQGSLLELVEQEFWRPGTLADHLPAPSVVIKLRNAIDAELPPNKALYRIHSPGPSAGILIRIPAGPRAPATTSARRRIRRRRPSAGLRPGASPSAPAA